MLSWVIIIILAVMAAAVLKMSHIKHRLTLVVLIIIALFITSTIGVVSSNNELDLSSTDGFLNAAKVYFGWLGNGFQNMKVLTGQAIGMDWTSTNVTIIEQIRR
jgi:hypothetical protein